MKKKLMMCAVLLTLLFASCDLRFLDRTYIVGEDAFQETHGIELRQDREGHIDVPHLDEDGTLYFIALADPHFGREKRDGGVSRSEGTLLDFISLVSRNDLTFPVLLLGDVQDKGTSDDEAEAVAFIERMRAADEGPAGARLNDPESDGYVELPVLFTCGNHELESQGVEHWEETYREHAMLTGAYSIRDTVLYNVNSAYRVYGGRQLELLDRAMDMNEGKYGVSLIMNHIPLASSRVDQTLFEFIIGDERERNGMLNIMEEHSPVFMLSGHHHKGNILSRYAGDSSEFIFSAYHKRDVFFESPGRWYIFSLDENTHECHIYGFEIHKPVESLDPADWLSMADEHYSFILNE